MLGTKEEVRKKSLVMFAYGLQRMDTLVPNSKNLHSSDRCCIEDLTREVADQDG